MRDVNHFVAVLRDATEIDELELNADGQADLEFNDGVLVSIVRLSETELELTAAIGQFRSVSELQLRRLMEANYLGDATGAARLALHPGGLGVVLCQRVKVTAIEGVGVEDCVSSFLSRVRLWESSEGRSLVNRQDETSSEEAYDEGTLILRI